MTPAVVLLALLVGQALPPTGLREAVESFWTYLQNDDPASALRYIHPDDLNAFLNRKRLRVTSASWIGFERLGEGSFSVQVSTRQDFQGKSFPIRKTQIWEKTEQGWKVRVKEIDLTQGFLMSSLAREPQWPAEIRLYPARITFYKGANLNRASLTIQNGLEVPLDVIAIELDGERFKMLESPTRVSARTRERVLLEFVGEETENNLTSKGLLRLRVAGDERQFDLAIEYNVITPTMDWVKAQVGGQKVEKPQANPPRAPNVKPPQNPKPPRS